MEKLRKRIRKVVAGLAAFLLTCLQFFGSLDMPHVPMPYGMVGYTWTDYGIRAQLMHEQAQQQQTEQQTHDEHMARLEGEVREDQLRTAAERERADREKAAS